ncbi:MAG: S8/S53 family peptidase [Chitinophagaceae bacterium]|nr:S8/S53 family peptidase [Chitinophagaceae bacterium]
MRQLLAILSVALLLAACKKSVQPSEPAVPNPEAKPVSAINTHIRQVLEQQGQFNWNNAPAEMVWSALEQSDHILSVGYKPAGESNVDDKLHMVNINDAAWKSAREQVLQIIYEEERRTDPAVTKESLEVWPEEVLPVMDVVVKNYSTILRLRASGLVRYAEPLGYDTKLEVSLTESSSGCGSNVAEGGLVNGTHYTVVSPNTKASWNYSIHGVQSAWAKSTGSGVKIFIIDTGSEFDQENLGSAFNQGNSSGRTIERIVTLPRNTFLGIPIGPVETPDDGCGHGTSMAGACAAPRGTDGNTVGIAYNCNLVTCRAAADVFLDESREAKGVADAYTNAANRTDVKIISMSMGRITSSSQVTDAVNYAYGKGKLLFCAAGTSFSWTASWYGVIFPAWLGNVQAVTGVKQNTNFTNCDACHKGSEVDFVVVMERAGDNVHPLSLAMSGDAPSTVGGSSVSTASMAGMAALVWSRFPTLTRDQVITKLQQNSSRYPTKNNQYGWGTLNVNNATN